MSLTDDLALVTACRDAPPAEDVYLERRVTLAALSLIEDTLNRHRFGHEYVGRGGATLTACHHCEVEWPCVDYSGALAALHTIATALGVAVEVDA